jgi:acyl carrier protein
MTESGWERTSMMPKNGVVAGEVTRTGVEQAVVEWLRAELDDPEITSSDNFLDIGGHSLTFLRLNRFLGAKYGVALDQPTAYNNELAVAVAAMRASEQNAT